MDLNLWIVVQSNTKAYGNPNTVRFFNSKITGPVDTDLFVSKRFDFQKGFEAEEPTRTTFAEKSSTQNSWCAKPTTGFRWDAAQNAAVRDPSQPSERWDSFWRIWWWVNPLKIRGDSYVKPVKKQAKLSWCSRFGTNLREFSLNTFRWSLDILSSNRLASVVIGRGFIQRIAALLVPKWSS